jgi:AcrR family transcriptional regulator
MGDRPARGNALSPLRQGSAESDAVLDAAASCYLRFGVAKTTAVDIARAVGISRATLYRRFGSHEAIFLAVITRESEAMAVDAEVHLAHVEDPLERILEGMLFSIEQIGRRPVHAAVFGSDSAACAATKAIRAEALRRIGEAGIRPLLDSSFAGGTVAAGGTMSELDTTDLVDWIIRILISYSAVPGDGGRQPEEVRRQLAAWFLPAFENMVDGRMPRGVRH